MREMARARAGASSATTTSPPTRSVGRCRSPRSSSSRSRARSPSAAGCSCSTSRRAASAAADVERLFALLAPPKAQGHAIVYISHFIEEVKSVADRFVVLRDGRNAGGGATADATHDDIVAPDGRAPGRTICFRARRAPAGEAHPRGRRRSSLGRATFTLHRGEILGIAGLLGAGRTRLLRTLFGLEPVRSGRIRVGVYTGRGAPARALGAGHGDAERGPQGGRTRARAEHRRQPDDDAG